MAAYLVARSDHWWWRVVLAVVVVCTRSDLGLAVAALGLVLVSEDNRNRGWPLATFGLAWFLIMSFVIQPLLGDGAYPHLGAFAHFGDGAAGILFGMLTAPAALLGEGRSQAVRVHRPGKRPLVVANLYLHANDPASRDYRRPGEMGRG